MNWKMTENLESVFMICKYLTLHKRKKYFKDVIISWIKLYIVYNKNYSKIVAGSL